MSEIVEMEQKSTGLKRKGFYGFSWTCLLFGAFPCLFRGDLPMFFLAAIFETTVSNQLYTQDTGILIPNVLWLVIVRVVWAFLYNNFYTKNLIEKGYTKV